MDDGYRWLSRSLLLIAAVWTSTWTASGGEPCCAHCGCETGCRKICRLVPQDKKITTVCYKVVSEDFCDPGPSTPGCQHCETVCEECDEAKGTYVPPKRLWWTEWTAGGTNGILTRKKLLKKSVTKTIPGYKWMIEDLCPACESQCQSAAVAPGTTAPPAPAVPGVIVIGQAESPTPDTKP